MNDQTSNAFGYKPRDLLRAFADRGSYSFVRARRAWGDLIAMDTDLGYENGDTVFCIPFCREYPRHHLVRSQATATKTD